MSISLAILGESSDLLSILLGLSPHKRNSVSYKVTELVIRIVFTLFLYIVIITIFH